MLRLMEAWQNNTLLRISLRIYRDDMTTISYVNKFGGTRAETLMILPRGMY
jgi:hypothetical protein